MGDIRAECPARHWWCRGCWTGVLEKAHLGEVSFSLLLFLLLLLELLLLLCQNIVIVLLLVMIDIRKLLRSTITNKECQNLKHINCILIQHAVIHPIVIRKVGQCGRHALLLIVVIVVVMDGDGGVICTMGDNLGGNFVSRRWSWDGGAHCRGLCIYLRSGEEMGEERGDVWVFLFCLF